MSKRRFTPGQISELLKNKNVVKCSPKAITYSKDFKLIAVKQYDEEGKTSTEIFREAGFDRRVVGEDTAKQRVGDWARIFRTKGILGLTKETRGRGGGRPKTKGLTDADKMKRMAIEIAYLKAENSFLDALRAKRAE